jgi:serine phosphatase RsbU (regulator of sigma subunit)/PAS domain-containing protein
MALDLRMDSGDGSQDFTNLKQQNIQLQHLLKYKDEVELPILKGQMQKLQGDLQGVRNQLEEFSRQEDFTGKRTGILHLDREGRVMRINAFALEVLGLTVNQAIGRPIRELAVHVESGRPIFGDIDYYLEPEGRESEWEKEIPLQRGEKRYFQFRSRQLGGTRLISIQDVTDLRIWESRVKAIIGSAKDGIALVDESGVIRVTNARFGKLFGLNWRQFAGMQFSIAAELLQYHFVQPSDFMSFLSRVQEENQLHLDKLFEMAMPTPGAYQIYTRPIEDEQNRHIGRVWFVTDVSLFKEMEKSLTANALELEDKVEQRTELLRQRSEQLANQNAELVQMRQEMDSELDVAKQVQQGMLPKNLPIIPGWDLFANYQPTYKVSGDYYDVEWLDEDHLFVLMTDVSGHGVPAALVTAMAKMAFDRRVRKGKSVAQVLADVNVDLCAAIKTEHYLTAFAAIFEISTGRVQYSRVCHPYPIVYRHRTQSLEHLKMRGGFFLGMFEDTTFSEDEVILHPGDQMFIYTDGVHESLNPRDELFGRKRLEAVVQRYAHMGAFEVIAQVQKERDRFAEGRQPQDDITLFAIRRLTVQPQA